MVFRELKNPYLRLLQPLLAQFVLLVAFFVASKLVFLLFYSKNVVAADIIKTLWHGLSLDCSVAAWLALFPTVLALAGLWVQQRKILQGFAKTYFFVIAFLLSAIVVLNLTLYAYWQFPLDSTPLFYFFSSPADALASAPLWQLAVGCIAVVMLTCFLFSLLCRCCLTSNDVQPKRIIAVFVLLAFSGILFITGRGGVTVSTMNTGHAYFSARPILNHAAVNPVFSLAESLARENDFASQYRFFTDDEAIAILNELNQPREATTSTLKGDTLLYIERPDILFIILESFSSHLLPALGGSPVATQLDSIARSGLLFTDFYANSFRTDRGLVSILSAFPAQPTNSLMKYPRKTRRLPSVATALARANYAASYYYGGDADFTNMRSYLTNAGFQDITSDSDFPLRDRLSKWGVPDGPVFDRLLRDIKNETDGKRPHFRVVQTGSSHEPFDVPAYKRFADPRLNAFAYTDSCLGRFIRELSRIPAWQNTLVVILPDHQGCWPDTLENHSPERYRIPLVLTGGALRQKGQNATTGMQTDVAATLLDAMHLPSDDFPFSKNLLDTTAPHYAFFSYPDAMGMVRDGSFAVYDNAAGRPTLIKGKAAKDNLRYAKAFLQHLYDTIANL